MREGDHRCAFLLGGCSHHACIHCFSASVANRGFNQFIECPVCKGKVRKWKILEAVEVEEEISVPPPARRQTRSSSRRSPKEPEEKIKRISSQIVESKTFTIPLAELDSEPTQYHQRLNPVLKKQTAILTLTVHDPSDPSGGRSLNFSVEMVGEDMSFDDVCSEKSKLNLENIFLFFHAKLINGFHYNNYLH